MSNRLRNFAVPLVFTVAVVSTACGAETEPKDKKPEPRSGIINENQALLTEKQTADVTAAIRVGRAGMHAYDEAIETEDISKAYKRAGGTEIYICRTNADSFVENAIPLGQPLEVIRATEGVKPGIVESLSAVALTVTADSKGTYVVYRSVSKSNRISDDAPLEYGHNNKDLVEFSNPNPNLFAVDGESESASPEEVHAFLEDPDTVVKRVTHENDEPGDVMDRKNKMELQGEKMMVTLNSDHGFPTNFPQAAFENTNGVNLLDLEFNIVSE